jgi:hypothetical protein
MILNKSEAIQAEWLIGQIREIDRLIDMHQSGDSNFMAHQYASRRLQYFKELIILLTTSKFNASGQETFPLVQDLIKENYPSSQSKIIKHPNYKSFDRTLSFYNKVSTKVASKNVTKASPSTAPKASVIKLEKVKSPQ